MKKLRPTSLNISALPTEASSTEPALERMPRLGQLQPTSRPNPLSPSSLERLRPPKRAPLRVLDFDIENRPLSYLGHDFTTADITAIAASFCGKGEVSCWLLGHDKPEDMLQGFVDLYDEADMVTGHFIRKHDLPIINGALMEYGLPPLKPKLTSDTKLDLLKRSGISASQENLAAMLGVPSPKVGMNQHMWRQANRLEPDGIELVRQRVVGDVKQHKQLRRALVERGMLGPPRMWKP
jgi:hypothetical protein